MISINIIFAIAKCFEIYMYMILVRCLLTWIPIVNWNNPIVNAFRASVDLYLDLFRKFIPPVGMFDLSPIVAMFVLVFIRGAIIYGALFLMSQLKIIG
jgi:YggT family protein